MVCCVCFSSVKGMSAFDCSGVFVFQAEDGIRDLVRSRGLGDVYKRQVLSPCARLGPAQAAVLAAASHCRVRRRFNEALMGCLLYTSDAADERSSVDLGGRRIIKKKKSSYSMRSSGSDHMITQGS